MLIDDGNGEVVGVLLEDGKGETVDVSFDNGKGDTVGVLLNDGKGDMVGEPLDDGKGEIIGFLLGIWDRDGGCGKKSSRVMEFTFFLIPADGARVKFCNLSLVGNTKLTYPGCHTILVL